MESIAYRRDAIAKAKKYDEVYERMGTREGEKEHKIAKARAQSQRDVGNAKCVKDEKGEVLVMDDEIQSRWRRYFEGLLNEGAKIGEQGEEVAGEKGMVEEVSFVKWNVH